MISHLVLAAIEFLVINWLGKHSLSYGYHQISFIQTAEDAPLFNLVFRILAPTVFLVITAALWYAVGWDSIVHNYWRVTVLYFALRWAFVVALGRVRLIRWTNQVLIAGLAIWVSVIVSRELLSDRAILLPSARGLTDELWIVIIAFVYVTASRISWPPLGKSVEMQRHDYLRARYRLFYRKYGKIVTALVPSVAAQVLVWAIMIYESFNRPTLYQWIENYILFPSGLAHSLGPMQVQTSLRLPTRELVRLGVEKVKEVLDQAINQVALESPEMFVGSGLSTEAAGSTPIAVNPRFEQLPSYLQAHILRKAAALYNIRSDYPDQVLGIHEFLRDYYYPELSQKIGVTDVSRETPKGTDLGKVASPYEAL